jgi:hypothetical protein
MDRHAAVPKLNSQYVGVVRYLLVGTREQDLYLEASTIEHLGEHIDGQSRFGR